MPEVALCLGQPFALECIGPGCPRSGVVSGITDCLGVHRAGYPGGDA